jgi:ATP-dependent Lhr-like helicase
VRDYLASHGATFFDELVRGTGLLRTQIEEALGDLVASGLATADSFTGLRALLTPSNRRPPLGGRSRRGASAVFGMESAGRWTLVSATPAPAVPVPDAVETIARVLLRRYGIITKRLMEREAHLPPWRELLRVFRRLEARGEIRGGRFVAGFAGEQFALPEAVGMLRAARRAEASGTLVSVSAADPLNLVGVILPGERVPALSGNRILFRDGVPAGTRVGGVNRLDQAGAPDAAAHHAAETALVRRRVAPRLRAYLGR